MRFEDQEQRIRHKLKVICFAIIATVGLQPQKVLAQAMDLRDGTMNVQAVVFDAHGGHHTCAYGYYGPPLPYFSDPQLANTYRGFSDSPIVGTCQID
jgi:hypothetical protein